MRVESSEALLVGEVGPEGEPHIGPWGQDDLLPGSLLGVCCLPATEGCQLLVLCFNLRQKGWVSVAHMKGTGNDMSPVLVTSPHSL